MSSAISFHFECLYKNVLVSLNPQQQGNTMNKMHLTGNSRTPPPPSTHQSSHHQMGSLGPQHHHQQQTPMLQQQNSMHMPMSAPTATNPGHHHHATSSSSAHRKLFTNLNANSQVHNSINMILSLFLTQYFKAE